MSDEINETTGAPTPEPAPRTPTVAPETAADGDGGSPVETPATPTESKE